MRVITGIAKGRKIRALEGEDVRPTIERVKEAMFSTIQFEIEGANVLDLFAGSGQLGIEALSRGARHCTFVDSSAKSIDCIRENIKVVGFNDKARIIPANSNSFLKATTDKFDFIFVDPPYEKGIVAKTLNNLSDKVMPNGKVICEHEHKLELAQSVGELTMKKQYKHGKTIITIYVKGDES
ncbi:MAG: 16S rRNA (guanine(966)-N(2))-methyltransferase RsmD [Clostridiales bacterium]|nr:16S rRNA (guanine(966)-N(2))-methyltransferase RsmD [Clostridiales bacterium]